MSLDETKGGAQRARTVKVRRGGSPVTATPIYHLPSASANIRYGEEKIAFPLVKSELIPLGRQSLS
jgi:hypothetical protein